MNGDVMTEERATARTLDTSAPSPSSVMQEGPKRPMSDAVTGKVLDSVRVFLERLIATGVLPPDELTGAHMAVTALSYQSARLRYPADRLAGLQAREHALVGSLDGRGAGRTRPRQWAEGWRSQVGAELVAGLEADVSATDPETVRQVLDFLETYHRPLDPAISAGTASTYQGGRGDGSEAAKADAERELTAESFERYLHERRPEFADARVTEAKRLMGGYSKQTYIVRLERGGTPERIVLRKDGVGLPTGSSVISEYPVLGEVHAAGVPTPRVLWLENGASNPFGTAFMGMSMVDGVPANRIVPDDPAVRRRWAQSCGEAVATLHRATALEGGGARAPLEAEIDDLERRVSEREREPHPGLAIGLAWLRANLDTLSGRPACRIHGDLGFHNFLMADDRLQAVLDWEFSRIGDPAEDLIAIKTFMDQIEAWPVFLAAYREGCDFEIAPAVIPYFNVWREVRNMVACLGSLNSLLMPEVHDVALSVAGTIYIPKYEVEVLKQILEAEAHV